MEEYNVKVKSLHMVTHDVVGISTEKPAGISFVPGQATEISINKKGWIDARRPFTFTSLPEADHLEFTIKTYPDRKGVTNELLNVKPGDELILHDVFGAIQYSREGVFIAGGAGVTPFIAIFRSLQSKHAIGDNMLIFANKTQADIILEPEFKRMLGSSFINILSEEKSKNHYYGFISEAFLKAVIPNFDQQFYVCGPQPMIDAVLQQLAHLGVTDNTITIEV